MLPTTTRRTDTPIDMLQREIGRAFDRVLDVGELARTGAASYPVDIREDENHVIVEAELPGFKKDEIEVTLEQGVLAITAQRQTEHEQGDRGDRYLHERRYDRVNRAFRLPTAVDEDKIDAKLVDGVLTLHLPKRDEVKPHKIEVQ